MARTFDPFREIFGDAPRTVGMPMDLVRTGDDFVVSIDLPGVDPSSIDIDAEERTLTIRATRNTQSADGQWLVRERPTGTFARQLTLGNGLALDRVKAGYADGVLTLHIPVAEEAKPRKIAVEHSGGQQSIEGEVAPSTESQEPMAS
ncbi:MAG TPA: Hsp20/alpha crystallin family protein [Propionibacteriaceae bacterium]|nr:Hsp20/alpha crystallin family protein [Propionibacteriaceae bacterium]